jgi:hypothetical protein
VASNYHTTWQIFIEPELHDVILGKYPVLVSGHISKNYITNASSGTLGSQERK